MTKLDELIAEAERVAPLLKAHVGTFGSEPLLRLLAVVRRQREAMTWMRGCQGICHEKERQAVADCERLAGGDV